MERGWVPPLRGRAPVFLTADVVCRYSGTAHQTESSVSMSGVGLTLEGINSATGAVTWSWPVSDAQALSLGTNVAFADSTHLVVRLQSGQQVVLDVQTGTTSPVTNDEVFWCEQNPEYAVSTAQGASVDGKRQSSPVFSACSATGALLSGSPPYPVRTIGVSAGGMFVWPTPQGLLGARLPG